LGASVKSAMQLGTVKYSGKAIKAGFWFEASITAASAAAMLSIKVLRIFMWSKLTFIYGASFCSIGFVFEHLNMIG
jgi:hypothetical protein